MSGWGVRVIALLAVVGSYWLVYQYGGSAERTEAEAASATWDSGDRLAEVLGERGAPRKNKAAAHEEVRAHAQEQRTLAAGAAGADAAGQRLHDEAGQVASAVGCPGQDPAVAARSEAARRSAMVLCDLLNRSVETNRELAAAFDRARVAGLAASRPVAASNEERVGVKTKLRSQEPTAHQSCTVDHKPCDSHERLVRTGHLGSLRLIR